MVRHNVYNYKRLYVWFVIVYIKKKNVCMVRYNVYNYKRMYVWFVIMYLIIKDCMYGSS